MTTDFVVKLADAARKKGHDVDIWLSGNGTMLSKKGQRSFKDYSSLEKTIKDLVDGGTNVTACEACAEARGYHKEDLIDGFGRKSMDWYLASCFSADRVLHIGGE
ncbi:DsrE family protein [Candidatus Magnetobacterium bavaricum]|uniref:DsrE family protein n=1 Tax=Candidatus Magnetobacterium bavaricum TaxID=29290 RepID=A0A0F3GPK6_9BACT|nr:DsrE family protein [Candidatus Magnetobacterium bavaricum]